jgi:2-isopropylmalate synthase
MADLPEFQVYDTTLRDGAQQEGIVSTVEEKLEIARHLDDFGVDFIEGGWPGAVPKDTEFFRRAATELRLRNAQLAAFGATRRPGGRADSDPQVAALLEAETPVVTLVAKSHDRHVQLALRTTLAENLEMVRDTVRHLVAEGRRVFLDAEHYFDGYRANPDYALAVAAAAVECGAEKVVLCDTNGGTLPQPLAEIVAETVARGIPVGIHCHDDAGCAVANTLLAVEAGARHAQGTANGYGERCGNANLFSVVANLVLKQGEPLRAAAQLPDMAQTARVIGDLVAIPVPPAAPYTGGSAFTHKAGLHTSALRIDASLYQHIEPERVGNSMRALVSDLGGRSSIALKAREMGVEVAAGDRRVGLAVERVKRLAEAGYSFESADASFALVLREELDESPVPHAFEVESWRTVSFGGPRDTSDSSRVQVRLTRAGRSTVANGIADHPVKALHRAVLAALIPVFPAVQRLELKSHEIRVLASTGVNGPAGVRVLLRFYDGEQQWGTVGVHRDMTAAALLALRDAADYLLADALDGDVDPELSKAAVGIASASA